MRFASCSGDPRRGGRRSSTSLWIVLRAEVNNRSRMLRQIGSVGCQNDEIDKAGLGDPLAVRYLAVQPPTLYCEQRTRMNGYGSAPRKEKVDAHLFSPSP